jgi:hypothetical protein
MSYIVANIQELTDYGEEVNWLDFVTEPITPRSLVSLEAFFTNCSEEGLFGCPLTNFPNGIAFIYELLKNIRLKENVANILVEITGIVVAEIGDKFMWPYSERIYIITSANQEEVSNWVKTLMPDLISEGWLYDVEPYPEPHIPEGNKVYNLFWDEERDYEENEKARALRALEPCPF